MKCLMHKSLTQFTCCIGVLFLLSLPLFYLLTKHYMHDSNSEQEMLIGIMFQFILIICILAISLILMIRFITHRLWIPFDDTLKRIERFSLEGGSMPEFTTNDVKEFTRLNIALTRLIEKNLHSYQIQKEFAENASHELQTPLAVIQSHLDSLLQEPQLTKQQAHIVQNLYKIYRRLSRLNKNLLLLVRIENRQYLQSEQIDVIQILNHVLSMLDKFANSITIEKSISEKPLLLQANSTLVESMINNLMVNAFLHNKPGGKIFISIENHCLSISNTSTLGELDTSQLFHRFNRTSEKVQGNGLGLAIVKAICDYHNWEIRYEYKEERHCFKVLF